VCCNPLNNRSSVYAVQMKSRQWTFISDDAKDLIHRMLELDQDHRITIDEVLRHPWIKVGIVV